jgi:RimJ/RimL family protein N-acetyltransferase
MLVSGNFQQQICYNDCHVIERQEVELGYPFVPHAWAQGYATEAGKGVLQATASAQDLGQSA